MKRRFAGLLGVVAVAGLAAGIFVGVSPFDGRTAEAARPDPLDIALTMVPIADTSSVCGWAARLDWTGGKGKWLMIEYVIERDPGPAKSFRVRDPRVNGSVTRRFRGGGDVVTVTVTVTIGRGKTRLCCRTRVSAAPTEPPSPAARASALSVRGRVAWRLDRLGPGAVVVLDNRITALAAS